ncbi:MAG TPA: DHA2 family efflux MFS transporter permease subunit, partial [Steroidobacteraceae bacterium]|nr:DHA2 family efflux MFS transporter permease subunit [Steroidobacteraceae bacterium]
MSEQKQPLTTMQGTALVIASAGVSLASFMQVLDQTIANVSLPTIAGNLGVSPHQGTWIVTSFGVASAISLPLTGWLSRRIGQVRLLFWSMSLFVLASVLCGLSTSLEMLVLSRVLQGAVAGPMMPLSQAMLLQIFPPERRLSALSLWSTVAIIGPICGPLLGGWITDNWGWRWIFFLNVPFGLIATTLMVHSFAGKETATERAPVDVIGLVLLAIWVGALQMMLDTGNHAGWFDDRSIIALAIIAVIGFCYFLVWELTEAHPVVDLRLFARRNFAVGVTCTSIGYTVFFGTALVVPIWLQTQMGYSAVWSGLAAAPVSLFPLILSRRIGKALQLFDPRLFASCAFIAFGAGLFMRSGFTTQVDYFGVISAQLVTGLGLAMFMVPLQAVLLSGLRADQVASAAGLSNFMRNIGGAFGASLATTIWARREAVHHAQLAESVTTWDS